MNIMGHYCVKYEWQTLATLLTNLLIELVTLQEKCAPVYRDYERLKETLGMENNNMGIIKNDYYSGGRS